MTTVSSLLGLDKHGLIRAELHRAPAAFHWDYEKPALRHPYAPGRAAGIKALIHVFVKPAKPDARRCTVPHSSCPFALTRFAQKW
jgi:hypothetical protein